MSIEAVATRVLESLYDLWFKDYVVGYSILDLARQLQYEENKIIQAIQLLEANGLITTHYPGRYVITYYGIDKREEILSPSSLAAKKEERRKILELLAEVYEKDPHARIPSSALAEGVELPDRNYLLGTVVYLENVGLVKLDMLNRGNFYIRLTINGYQALQDKIPDNSAFMLNAYRLLFNLENYMRKFIQI